MPAKRGNTVTKKDRRPVTDASSSSSSSSGEKELHASSDESDAKETVRDIVAEAQSLEKATEEEDGGKERITYYYGVSPVLTFQCLGCGADFLNKKAFDMHNRQNSDCASSNPPLYTCEECRKVYVEKEKFQDHASEHLKTSLKSLLQVNVCEHCGKGFETAGTLHRHLWLHSDDNPHKCEHCGKGFHSASVLTNHLMTHLGSNKIKIHECEVCGKRFSHDNSLRRHRCVHTGEKPYKCGRCEKAFTTSTNLRRHLMIHLGIKPHKCEHCGKEFRRMSHLQRHLQTHKRRRRRKSKKDPKKDPKKDSKKDSTKAQEED